MCWVGGRCIGGTPESLSALPRTWTHHAQHRVSLKHSGQDSPFLKIGWVTWVWGPVLLRSLQLCGPTSVCIIAKIGLFSWLVRDVPVLGCVALGWGCFFLKATSYVCPVLLSPFCLPFCCSASPFFPTTPPSRILESTFVIFVFTVGWALCFISCFICKSFFFFFLSFLSLRKSWLRFLS